MMKMIPQVIVVSLLAAIDVIFAQGDQTINTNTDCQVTFNLPENEEVVFGLSMTSGKTAKVLLEAQVTETRGHIKVTRKRPVSIVDSNGGLSITDFTRAVLVSDGSATWSLEQSDVLPEMKCPYAMTTVAAHEPDGERVPDSPPVCKPTEPTDKYFNSWDKTTSIWILLGLLFLSVLTLLCLLGYVCTLNLQIVKLKQSAGKNVTESSNPRHPTLDRHNHGIAVDPSHGTAYHNTITRDPYDQASFGSQDENNDVYDDVISARTRR